MTEYEFLEASVLYGERILDSAMNLITVMFAYLAASHFVGKQLSPSVAVGFTVIYSLWSLVTIVSIVAFLVGGFEVQHQYLKAYPDGWIFPNEPPRAFWLIGSLTPMILGWVASIYYLHFVVRASGVQPEE